MILDIRYYIITLTAIFISIAIGVLIGFNMNGQELLLEQQRQLAENLESRFDELQFENSNLKDAIEAMKIEKKYTEEFMEKAYYTIINNQLINQNIAIIQTTEHFYYDHIIQTLKDAGAIISAHILFTDKINNIEQDDLDRIESKLNINLKRQNFAQILSEDIFNLVAHSVESNLLNILMEYEFVKILYKEDYVAPTDKIIIAGGSYHVKNQMSLLMETNIVKTITSNNMRIIGVERLETPYSSIPLYKKLGISTIDNVNTLLGRISLVLVANGIDGYFGEGAFSEELIPLNMPKEVDIIE